LDEHRPALAFSSSSPSCAAVKKSMESGPDDNGGEIMWILLTHALNLLQQHHPLSTTTTTTTTCVQRIVRELFAAQLRTATHNRLPLPQQQRHPEQCGQGFCFLVSSS
jgi:hypothetical protein